ncbi:MAG: dipeptidase PepE [Bacteroidota bacterium]|jgi:dipeptidase E|nr:dipeptidase PepE [Bacteroidota bacterium]
MSQKRILALSSSRAGNSGYLETAIPLVKNLLGDKPIVIAFIPFASVDKNYEAYASMVREAFIGLPYIINVASSENAKEVIINCDAIVTGGGNTFKLLHDIYELNLLDIIRDKISAGIPFIGWSAGANILGPTISTTNDMPIIEPKSFNALGLFPFQINPHYFNQKSVGFNGETRDQRLEEFVKMNPGIPVVGLPEGSSLLLEKGVLKFVAPVPGILFTKEENMDTVTRKEIVVETDLSYLL